MARLARWAWGVGGVGLVVGWLLLVILPQRPDGDLTTLAFFDARYPASPLHRVREAVWLNVAGALFGWGVFHSLLQTLQRRPLRWFFLALPLGLLVAWTGWAWEQTRGWQGDLFLEPGIAVPLGVDRTPTVTFERFLVPPAPDGPGRALPMRLWVDGVAHTLSAMAPYHGASWTLTPIWYGVTVSGPDLATPLFFGEDGRQEANLRTGERVIVTVETATLTVASQPPQDLDASYHAILRARFAPGEQLQQVGIFLLVGAAGGWLWAHRRAIMGSQAEKTKNQGKVG